MISLVAQGTLFIPAEDVSLWQDYPTIPMLVLNGEAVGTNFKVFGRKWIRPGLSCQ